MHIYTFIRRNAVTHLTEAIEKEEEGYETAVKEGWGEVKALEDAVKELYQNRDLLRERERDGQNKGQSDVGDVQKKREILLTKLNAGGSRSRSRSESESDSKIKGSISLYCWHLVSCGVLY